MGGKREGGGTTTATEGGVGQEGRGKSGGNTLSREKQKKGPEPRKVTQKQWLEDRRDHHGHDTRGT